MLFGHGILTNSPIRHLHPAHMLDNIGALLRQLFPRREHAVTAQERASMQQPPLTAFGLSDFLSLQIPRREMLLAPTLPERSLAMLYAPRGIGKSWLG